MSESSGEAPLSGDQFGGDLPDAPDSSTAPYTAQNPYGQVVSPWGFARTLFGRRKKEPRTEPKPEPTWNPPTFGPWAEHPDTPGHRASCPSCR